MNVEFELDLDKIPLSQYMREICTQAERETHLTKIAVFAAERALRSIVAGATTVKIKTLCGTVIGHAVIKPSVLSMIVNQDKFR